MRYPCESKHKEGHSRQWEQLCKDPKAKCPRPAVEKEFFNMAEAMVWAGWNHFCAIGENSGLNQ